MTKYDSWTCKICKTYNDFLTDNCKSCQSSKPFYITSYIQAICEIKRGIFNKRGILGINNMTEQEELFAKLYNHEKILVKDMDASQLRQHRDELSKIAFEAKARVTAADEEIRERGAKDKKTKEWTLSSSDIIHSDVINEPKVRQARMTKMDKIKASLLTAGIDEKTVAEMIKNLEKTATDKNLKTVTFSKKTEETTAIQVEAKKDSKPFDASSIKFGS